MKGPVRVAAALVAAGALAGSLVLSLLWLLQADSYWFVLVASYTPYALIGYLVALAGLLLWRPAVRTELRRWVTGAVLLAVAGIGLHACLLAPAYLGSHPDGPGNLTVLTLNTKHGRADAAAVVRQARQRDVQVLVLEEVTPRLLVALRGEGLTALLPQSAGAPGPGASGTMVFSTYPLSEVVPVPLTHGAYRLRVAAPTPFWLVAVHLGQPLNEQGSLWRGDWSVLDQVVGTLSGPVLIAGDFNSTLEHRPLRRLLDRGFADAARQANAGWQPTYPNGLGLIAIDHVLVRGLAAAGTWTTPVLGTDHRALGARLAVSPGARK